MIKMLITQEAGGRITDSESQNLDLGIDKLVPVNALGKKYLIKSKSKIDSNNHRVELITAVEEGTTSYTFSGSSYSLCWGGVRYHRIANLTTMELEM